MFESSGYSHLHNFTHWRKTYRGSWNDTQTETQFRNNSASKAGMGRQAVRQSVSQSVMTHGYSKIHFSRHKEQRGERDKRWERENYDQMESKRGKEERPFDERHHFILHGPSWARSLPFRTSPVLLFLFVFCVCVCPSCAPFIYYFSLLLHNPTYPTTE